ncbi:chemotaxis signal transduction protein [Leptolyngbya sp. Heron Island J]|uniref:chemotaxis protein CheW n=1 Tax=Leptolyngbya sp. Heron Island J TaxID=1385935 RepID=UPI0003B944D7|nr:chemotaxis protein CheW [Leptolyngbya sp. Heron Island J]ESA34927.1 chemotaxis signal transduction protein [Leptolyngbya sp. Heron Island J]
MTPLSSLKSRRLRTYKGEPTQQVIVFQMQREWFALPIFAVKKVVRKSETQGDYHNSGTGLTVYEGKELLVLDISQQLFGSMSYQASLPAFGLPEDVTSQSYPYLEQQSAGGYLIIIRSHQGELAGLPVASSPAVRRFAQSAIVPLPSNYATRVNIRCVSGLIVQSDVEPLLFVLNPDQLLQTQPLLPPTI